MVAQEGRCLSFPLWREQKAARVVVVATRVIAARTSRRARSQKIRCCPQRESSRGCVSRRRPATTTQSAPRRRRLLTGSRTCGHPHTGKTKRSARPSMLLPEMSRSKLCTRRFLRERDPRQTWRPPMRLTVCSRWRSTKFSQPSKSGSTRSAPATAKPTVLFSTRTGQARWISL